MPRGWAADSHPAHRPPGGGQGKGSWPPFEPGNMAAAKHGAASDRTVEPLAAQLAEQITALVGYLEEAPEFEPAIRAWSRAEAQSHLLTTWLDEHGWLDEGGEPRPATRMLESVERRAETLRSRLGLDPASRARLRRDLAISRGVNNAEYAQQLDAGRRILEQRTLPQPEEPACPST